MFTRKNGNILSFMVMISFYCLVLCLNNSFEMILILMMFTLMSLLVRLIVCFVIVNFNDYNRSNILYKSKNEKVILTKEKKIYHRKFKNHYDAGIAIILYSLFSYVILLLKIYDEPDYINVFSSLMCALVVGFLLGGIKSVFDE